MSDAIYATVLGFIPFEIGEREVNDETVRDVTVRDAVSGDLVRCTVWANFADVEIAQDDFVIIEGKLTKREHKGNTYYNLDSKRILNLGPAGLAAAAAEPKVRKTSTRTKAY